MVPPRNNPCHATQAGGSQWCLRRRGRTDQVLGEFRRDGKTILVAMVRGFAATGMPGGGPSPGFGLSSNLNEMREKRKPSRTYCHSVLIAPRSASSNHEIEDGFPLGGVNMNRSG